MTGGGHIAKAIKCFHAAPFELSSPPCKTNRCPGPFPSSATFYILLSLSMRLFDILSFETLISVTFVL